MLTLGLGLGLTMGSAAPPAPEVISWPYPFVNGAQVTGFGSSTMQGTAGAGQTSPFGHALNDSSATWTNRGAGGTTSATILAAVNAATSGEKAGDVVFQLGGNYAAGDNPEDGIMIDAASMAAALGHSRFLHVPKHNDAVALAGSKDWVRLRRLTRLLGEAYPGRVHDMALTFRHEPPADANDVTDQTNDVIPRSLQYDTAHTNTAGNLVIARRAYEPFVEALRVGGVPFIPDQRVISTDYLSAQTLNGLVCVVPYDASVFGALDGCVAAIDQAHPDFRAEIDAGEIKIRRASAILLTEGSYDLALWLTKGGKRRRSWIKVFLTNPIPPSTVRARNGANWLAKEGPLAGVTNSGKKLMVVIGLRCVSGAGTTRRLVQFGGSNGLNVEIKSSNRLGFVVKNAANTTVVNLDGPSGASTIGADASIRWLFMAADTTTGVQVAKVAVDALTAATNAPTADAILNIAPVSPTALQRFFSSTDSGGSLCDLEVAAIWMAEDYRDIGPTTGMRDLFRDAATGANLIPADGVVDGMTPFLYMAGPAGNWKAGLNLAKPDDRWEATDRTEWTTA
ncbi:SGNH/GDSL hydrolase family protein [Phenylobacterium sp.]|uniref:SGNH/GDSL hydrolase family protein n=1 Tax=Phenylobacterium sp. TaxID=1871053 RepID=UPI0035B4BFD1